MYTKCTPARGAPTPINKIKTKRDSQTWFNKLIKSTVAFFCSKCEEKYFPDTRTILTMIFGANEIK